MKRVVAVLRHDIFKLGLECSIVNPSDVKRGDRSAIKKQML
jgi:hypothetical protein